MAMKSRPSLAVHPGEILREEFIHLRGLDPGVLAGAIGVAPEHMKDIVNGEKGISREMTVLLAGYSGTSVKFWINLQGQYQEWAAGTANETAIGAAVKSESKSRIDGREGKFWKCREGEGMNALPSGEYLMSPDGYQRREEIFIRIVAEGRAAVARGDIFVVCRSQDLDSFFRRVQVDGPLCRRRAKRSRNQEGSEG